MTGRLTDDDLCFWETMVMQMVRDYWPTDDETATIVRAADALVVARRERLSISVPVEEGT